LIPTPCNHDNGIASVIVGQDHLIDTGKHLQQKDVILSEQKKGSKPDPISKKQQISHQLQQQ